MGSAVDRAPPAGAVAGQESSADLGSGGAVAAGRLGRWIVNALLVLAAGLVALCSLDPAIALLATVWACAVVVIVRSDLDRFIIPDAASACIAALGLAEGGFLSWREGAGVVAGLWQGVVAGGPALVLFWAVAVLYRRRKGVDGLGFGDVKLAGASAIWLTAFQQVAALEIACLAALAAVVITTRGTALRGAAVPFGAFLAPSAWLVFVVGPAVGGWIERSS